MATVVTGGAAGLGRVVAEELATRGHRLVLLDRDPEALATTGADLGARHGTPVRTVVADLSTPSGTGAAGEELTRHADIGALVNLAGGWLPGVQYPEAAPETWLSALHLNLVAPMLLTQLLWPRLAAARGAVVNVGSSGGLGEEAYGSPEYGAAKAGLHRFTGSLAARHDVRVMAVVPGWIGLERAHRERAALSEDERRVLPALVPPVDVARAVATLLESGRAGQVVLMLEGEPSSRRGPSADP